MKTIFTFHHVGRNIISGLMSQTTHDVNESGFAYNPDTITINAGDGINSMVLPVIPYNR
jgi:plastocyanin